MAAAAILDNFDWPYLRNGHRAVIFATAQLSCSNLVSKCSKNVLCLVAESTMLCFARIILQRAKCAITLRTMHELLGADSTMYIDHYLGLLQVGP